MKRSCENFLASMNEQWNEKFRWLLRRKLFFLVLLVNEKCKKGKNDLENVLEELFCQHKEVHRYLQGFQQNRLKLLYIYSRHLLGVRQRKVNQNLYEVSTVLFYENFQLCSTHENDWIFEALRFQEEKLKEISSASRWITLHNHYSESWNTQ